MTTAQQRLVCLAFVGWIGWGSLPHVSGDEPLRHRLSHTNPSPAPVLPAHSSFPRLAADFEPQSALVLSVSDWQPHHAPILMQIAQKTRGHVELLILCNDQKQIAQTLTWLADIADSCSHVKFAILELDTIWLRDFAPFFLQTAKGSQLVDFYYVGERPQDDRMPHRWSERTSTPLKEVPFTLQGGNLLSNGQHLAITTERIFIDNAIQFPNPLPGTDPRADARKIVTDAIIDGFNLRELVILDYLQSEATKHADMFCNFLNEHTVVMASVDPRQDPINAAILDRNARRLQSVVVDGKPLEVHRIQTPARDGESWSAFANVIIANDLLLMPVYQSDAPALVKAAVETYQRLLPEHTIETVDITTFKQLQGELHCSSMNLPKFSATLPNLISFADAMQKSNPQQ